MLLAVCLLSRILLYCLMKVCDGPMLRVSMLVASKKHEAVGPSLVLSHLTLDEMLEKLEHSGNFFPSWTKAMRTLSSTMRNCQLTPLSEEREISVPESEPLEVPTVSTPTY